MSLSLENGPTLNHNQIFYFLLEETQYGQALTSLIRTELGPLDT